MFGFLDKHDIGIDLGTATVLVFVSGKGIVLKEPSVVAVDKNTGKAMRFGEEARLMIGRTPENIVAVRPLRDGVISDFVTTRQMLDYFLKKAINRRFLWPRPRVIICVPGGVTEVEKMAVKDAALQAGANNVLIIEEPIAAAVGAGIDIGAARGNLVVDIGGGTTDIAVISLGGAVVTRSIKVAGNKFDEAIIKYMRRKHNLLIGERTAENMKIKIGAVYPRRERRTMNVTGRNLISGLPATILISSDEMIEALEEPTQAILDAVHSVLEQTPPELVSDVSLNGVTMTGGGSLLYGLDKMISHRARIPVNIAEDAVSCVAKGTGLMLEDLDYYKSMAIFDFQKNQQLEMQK